VRSFCGILAACHSLFLHRSGGDQFLELVEGSLFLSSPVPYDILLCEVKEGTRMVGEVLDKPPVEVDKYNEGLNLLPILRNHPFRHARNLHPVHLHCFFRHNYTEVLNVGSLEFALFGAELELILPQAFKHSPHHSLVFRQCLREDEDVI
jgi:hypothetical protein